MLSNFRCSNHDLMIERGRHLGIDRALRLCPLCKESNLSVVEDEYHLFFDCPKYEPLRLIYFKPYWNRCRNEHVFNSIFTLNNIATIRSVAKYLVEAFHVRKQFLEK